MPRPRRNNNNEESNNSKSVPYLYSKELETAASQALLEAVAVENDTTSTSPSSTTTTSTNAIVSNEKRQFLNLFHLHCQSNAHQPVDINDEGLSAREQRQLLFHCLSKCFKDGPAAQFFTALHATVEACVDNQQHVPESAFVVDDDDDDAENDQREEHEIVPDAASAASLSFLQYAALCVSAYFQEHNPKNNRKGSSTAAAAPLFDTALALHNCLDQLEDPSWGPECVAAHAAIVALCETWWTHDGPHRDRLIAQALPPLVENVLDVTSSSSNRAALKRLHSVRTALTVIDFDDAASDAFAHLLLRLASQPHCLKCAEGQRLLSFALWEIPALRSRLHQALRAQIPNNPSVTVLRGVGEIYFLAWNQGAAAVASDDTHNGNGAARQQLLTLEQDILQELVYTVIHGSHFSLVQNLRETVLAKFHDAKNKARGQALLQRLYGPILWRGLTAAHAVVRVQAAHVLAAVFPLSTDKNPVRQGVSALQQLLQDADPRVRCAGSQAVADILTTYWDVVPAKDIRVLLNYLVAEHASDATSAPVRAGALNAVTILLEAPQSIAVLRDLLPSLGNLIHDKVEKVRLAAVRMLLRLKKTNGIKYYHVVPLEHLNARLAEEGKANPTNSVAAALTGLMVNSYFPVGQNVDPAEQIRRTLKFLTEDPDAAEVFYANIYKFRPVDAVSQLCVKLLRCLHSAIEKDRQREAKVQSTKSGKRRRHRVRSEDDNNTASGDGGQPFPSALMASLAETVGILWDSIETDLEDDEEWNNFVVGEFSGATLTDILSYCEDKAANANAMDDEDEAEYMRRDCTVTTAAILRCAGRLPAKAVKGLVPHIASLMSSIQPPHKDDDDAPAENITSHVALLCSWGMTEEVASSLASSINSGFEEDDLLLGSPVNNSKKRRSRRSGTNTSGLTASSVSVPALPAIAAVNVLSEILRGSDPSTLSAREAILSCEKAVSSLEKVLGAGLRHAESILSGESSAENAYACFLLQVCEAFGRFALHKEAFVNGTNITFNEQATTLMHWTTENVIPAFKPAEVPFVDPNISSIHVENSFAASFPASPEPIRRGGRRANLNRTPERLDEGLDMFEGSPSDVEVAQAAARVKRAFALSLMQNSCAIFSDWLTVGDSAAAFIAQATTKEWYKVFASCDKCAELLTTLGPDFWRMAVHLAKTGEEFGLFKRLLSCFHEHTQQIDNNSSTMVRKALTLLFSNRGPQANATVRKTVDCVVEAAYEQINQEGDELEYQLPISLGELWCSDVGCIGSALMAILTNKLASLELARQLAEDRFPAHVQDESTIQLALFDAKCLSLLCDGDSKVIQEAAAMARKLGEVGLNGNQELGSFVKELLDGLPAAN